MVVYILIQSVKRKECSGSQAFPLLHAIVALHFEMVLWFFHCPSLPQTMLAVLLALVLCGAILLLPPSLPLYLKA